MRDLALPLAAGALARRCGRIGPTLHGVLRIVEADAPEVAARLLQRADEPEVVDAPIRRDDEVRAEVELGGLHDDVSAPGVLGAALHLGGDPALRVAERDVEHALPCLELDVADAERLAVEDRLAFAVREDDEAGLPDHGSLARLLELPHGCGEFGIVVVEKRGVASRRRRRFGDRDLLFHAARLDEVLRPERRRRCAPGRDGDAARDREPCPIHAIHRSPPYSCLVHWMSVT